MNRTTATAMTGMAVAAAAGTAAWMMHQRQQRPAKKLKQGANKAIKTLGSVLDQVEYLMR